MGSKFKKILSVALSATIAFSSFVGLSPQKVSAATEDTPLFEVSDLPTGLTFDKFRSTTGVSDDLNYTYSISGKNVMYFDVEAGTSEIIYTSTTDITNLFYSEVLNKVYFSQVVTGTTYKQLAQIDLSTKEYSIADNRANYTYISTPDVSTDGKYLGYGVNVYAQYTSDNGQVVIVNTETDEIKSLTNFSANGYIYRFGIGQNALNSSKYDSSKQQVVRFIPGTSKVYYAVHNYSFGFFVYDLDTDENKIIMTPSSSTGQDRVHMYMGTGVTTITSSSGSVSYLHTIKEDGSVSQINNTQAVYGLTSDGKWSLVTQKDTNSNQASYFLAEVGTNNKHVIMRDTTVASGGISLSKDGSKIRAVVAGKLWTYDITRYTSKEFGDVQNVSDLTVDLYQELAYVKFKGGKYAEKYDIYVNGEKFLTTPSWLSYIPLPLVGDTEIKVVSVDSNGNKSSGVTTNVTTAIGKTFSFANKTVLEGTRVVFGGRTWQVAGDNLIVSADVESGTIAQTAIASKISSTILPSFSESDQSLMQSRSWIIKAHEDGSVVSATSAKMYFLSSQEVQDLSFRVARFADVGTTSANVWLTNPKAKSSTDYMYSSASGLMSANNSTTSNMYMKVAASMKPNLLTIGSGHYGDEMVIIGEGTEETVNAPTNLQVTTTSTTLDASWNSVSGATGYTVKVNDSVVYNGLNLFYKGTNLTPETSYKVSVTATNGTTTSSATEKTVTTEKAEVKLAKPANVKVETTHNSAVITWDAVEGADAYWVMFNNDQVYNDSDTTVTVNDLGSDRPYTVYIRAIKNTDTGIVESEQTSIQIVTKKDPEWTPGQPVLVTNEPGNVKISWTASKDSLLYKVYRNDTEIGSVTGLEYSDKTAKAGESYIYTVRSFNGSTHSDPSPILLVTVGEDTTTPVILDKPTNVIATPKATSIIVSWDAVPGATGYKIKQGQGIIYQGPITTFTQSDLPNGATYNYEVFAINGSVESEGVTVSATTLVPQLSYPANFRVTELKYNKVTLDWDAVDGADEYEISRDGMTIGVPMYPGWSEDSNSIMPGATVTYKVAALKNGVKGKEAIKVVTIPTEPVEGEAPQGDLTLKATRVYHDRVGLSWTTVTGATYYSVYQDTDNKVWTGDLNTITDYNVGPEETHTYHVVAGNEWGTLESNVIVIVNPSAPQSIVITPSQPMEGTITFNYKVVEGAVMYTERNPQTKAVPLGDGTYQVTYYNSATGETRDLGIQTPVNGMLTFSESGVDPNKNYHYEITAVVMNAQGVEEVVAKEEVSVTTPSDGSGITVPGTIVDPTDPGNNNGGGSTDPGNNGGGSTDPGNNNGGGSTGGGSTGGGSTGGGSTGGSTGGSSDGGSTGSTSNGGNETTTDKPKDEVTGTVVDPSDESGVKDPTTVPSDESAGVDFSDVSENHFAFEAIQYLSSKGIVKGYNDGKFYTDRTITRAEFAIMINRALGYSTDEYKHSFVDFKEDAWYAGELASALNKGITKGFTDGTYRPDAYIPREQASVMINNVLETNGIFVSESLSFKDLDSIIAWAVDSVSSNVGAGIISGYTDNTFKPKQLITRAEAAVLIFKLLNVINSEV